MWTNESWIVSEWQLTRNAHVVVSSIAYDYLLKFSFVSRNHQKIKELGSNSLSCRILSDPLILGVLLEL